MQNNSRKKTYFDDYKITKTIKFSKHPENLSLFMLSELYAVSTIFYYKELKKHKKLRDDYKKFRTFLANFIQFTEYAKTKDMKELNSEANKFLNYHNDFCDLLSGKNQSVPELKYKRKKLKKSPKKILKIIPVKKIVEEDYNEKKESFKGDALSSLSKLKDDLLKNIERNIKFHKYSVSDPLRINTTFFIFKISDLFDIWEKNNGNNIRSSQSIENKYNYPSNSVEEKKKTEKENKTLRAFEKCFLDIDLLNFIKRNEIFNHTTDPEITVILEKSLIDENIYSINNAKKYSVKFQKFQNNLKSHKIYNTNYNRTQKKLSKIKDGLSKYNCQNKKIFSETLAEFIDHLEKLQELNLFNTYFKKHIKPEIVHITEISKKRSLSDEDLNEIKDYYNKLMKYIIPAVPYDIRKFYIETERERERETYLKKFGPHYHDDLSSPSENSQKEQEEVDEVEIEHEGTDY